jgi:hypothetical protein
MTSISLLQLTNEYRKAHVRASFKWPSYQISCTAATNFSRTDMNWKLMEMPNQNTFLIYGLFNIKTCMQQKYVDIYYILQKAHP